MGKLTPCDPLGQRPDLSDFGDMINHLIDARIETRLAGRVEQRFDGVHDLALVHELLARGWAVFRPKSNEG